MVGKFVTICDIKISLHMIKFTWLNDYLYNILEFMEMIKFGKKFGDFLSTSLGNNKLTDLV